MEAYIHNGRYGKYAVRFLPRFFSFKGDKTAVILYSYDSHRRFFKTRKLESFHVQKINHVMIEHDLRSTDKNLIQELSKFLIAEWELDNEYKLSLPAIRQEQKSYLSKI